MRSSTRRLLRGPAVAGLGLWLGVAACAPEADPAGVGATDTAGDDGSCADAQTVGYYDFGQAFLLGNCAGCHAETAPNRYGAPESATFDTLDQVWDQAAAILAYATGDEPLMPPSGGTTADDRVRLEWWLACGEPGT